MKVFLDDSPISVSEPSLAGAIDAARESAERRSRVIVEVSVNGERVADDLIQDPESHGGVSDDDEVRFVSADPVSLVTVTMHDVADMLDAARPRHEKAAAKLQSGEMVEAMSLVGEVMQLWDAARHVLADGTSLLDATVDDLSAEIGGRTVSMPDEIRLLLQNLKEIGRCMSDEDWSALADTVGDDLHDAAGRWSVLLHELADRLASSGGGDPGTD